MSTQPKHFLTPEEYLEIERKAEYKSEYFGGEMFAMAGASRRHGLIVVNLTVEIGQRLKGKPCEAYVSDMRVRVSPTGLYTYPDIAVVCGQPKFADDQKDTLLNPTLLIEVLSESTRDYDRGDKFQQYRTLPSLREYLTIGQQAPHVEHWTRRPEGGWLLTEFGDLSQTVPLIAIDAAIPMSEIYDKVDWSA